MVTVGTLDWKVQVDNATEAKEQAREVEENVEGAKEAMEGADEVSGGLRDRFEGLSIVQQTVSKGLDKMNAKAGFMGTALTFLQRSVGLLIGSLGSLSTLVVGTVVAAFVALLALAPDFRKGFIQGIKSGLSDLWGAFKTGIDIVKGVLNTLGDIFGPIVGPLLEILGDLNEEFNILRTVGFAVGKALVFIAGAIVVIKVIAGIISVVGTLIGVFSTIIGVVGTIISVIGTLIGIFTTVISVVAAVIAALNPISLIILAIIGVIIALSTAWETNFLGIRDIAHDVFDSIEQKIQGFLNWVSTVPKKIQSFFKGMGAGLANAFRAQFNKIIPNEISIGSVTIGGTTIGGGTIDLPELQGGGLVEESGMAVVHEGEAVVPADVTRNALENAGRGRRGGDSQEMTKIEVNVGGVEIGDQSLDIGKMSRTDLRALANAISEQLGDDVRNVIS